MSCYTHLTIAERESLYSSIAQGQSIRAIGRKLQRSPSTISRELRRNSADAYQPSIAQKAYEQRRRRCVRHARLEDRGRNEMVRFFLTHLYWSPEQICQRLRREWGCCVVGTSTIYRALDSGLLRDTVRYYLRIKYKTHGKASKKKRSCFSKLITERPAGADDRSEPGHWEGDTVRGHDEKCRLLTLVDRKTRYTQIQKITCAEAKNVNSAVIAMPASLPVRSITFDQGTEFSLPAELEQTLHTQVFFAHPHSPWERPTNENTNGLIRQFVPKRTKISALSTEDITRFAAKLNLRPRKCLGWLSPYEVLFKNLLSFT